ncbi:hypothetical protein B5S28_g3617 [[Candida] boidinii]|nr:hypothetical protein B5S28_g3617 [[Candida] boidinii]GME96281.1 unnamed protein product [[Candida] boidinii]
MSQIMSSYSLYNNHLPGSSTAASSRRAVGASKDSSVVISNRAVLRKSSNKTTQPVSILNSKPRSFDLYSADLEFERKISNIITKPKSINSIYRKNTTTSARSEVSLSNAKTIIFEDELSERRLNNKFKREKFGNLTTLKVTPLQQSISSRTTTYSQASIERYQNNILKLINFLLTDENVNLLKLNKSFKLSSINSIQLELIKRLETLSRNHKVSVPCIISIYLNQKFNDLDSSSVKSLNDSNLKLIHSYKPASPSSKNSQCSSASLLVLSEDDVKFLDDAF